MTVLEFLILILKTHAESLQRLAAFYGEDPLLDLLEKAGEIEENNEQRGPTSLFILKKQWFLPAPLALIKTSPYTELEGTVHEMNLPEFLEFHLWAYPYYRTLIESPVDIKMKINPAEAGSEMLVKEAVFQAKRWLGQLPIQPYHLQQVETLALVPWFRFQNEALRRIGKRPLDAV
jgi:hypothetical protein